LEAQGNAKIIDIRNLTKLYGQQIGVKDLFLTLFQGEILGFLGPNGAGKTTAMRACLALISKTSGQIDIFGLDSHRYTTSIKKRVGYLPGEFDLIPSIKVKTYLEYLLSLNGCKSSEKMMALSEELDLELHRKTDELSKGNKQKVGIVQALMTDADLIIMDEPTAGLDPLGQQIFYKILRQEKKKGKTVFMSSHVLAEVESVCDRVAIIREGRVVVTEDISLLQEKTGKILEVEFTDIPDFEEFRFEGVSNISQDNGRIKMLVHSNLDRVIKTASNHRILNMNLETYSLEQLFLKYYSDTSENVGDA
jgi:ABC-2 type transport system ATP-binding protein